MKLLLTCLFVGISFSNAFGWNARDHMIVAAIAYRELEKNNPEPLRKINKLLKSQPSYQTWVAEYRNKPYSLEAYCFMRAAVWSDDIRSEKSSPT